MKRVMSLMCYTTAAEHISEGYRRVFNERRLAYKTACNEGGVAPKTLALGVFGSVFGFAGKLLTAQYVGRIFMTSGARSFELQKHHMQSLSAEVLRLDGNHKLGNQTQGETKGMVFGANENNEIVLALFSNSLEKRATFERVLRLFKERNEQLGAQVRVVYIDNVTPGAVRFYQDIFGEHVIILQDLFHAMKRITYHIPDGACGRGDERFVDVSGRKTISPPHVLAPRLYKYQGKWMKVVDPATGIPVFSIETQRAVLRVIGLAAGGFPSDPSGVNLHYVSASGVERVARGTSIVETVNRQAAVRHRGVPHPGMTNIEAIDDLKHTAAAANPALPDPCPGFNLDSSPVVELFFRANLHLSLAGDLEQASAAFGGGVDFETEATLAWDHVDSLYGALLDKEGSKRMSGQAGVMEVCRFLDDCLRGKPCGAAGTSAALPALPIFNAGAHGPTALPAAAMAAPQPRALSAGAGAGMPAGLTAWTARTQAGAAGSDAAAHPPIMAQPVFATMPSAGLGAYAQPPPERSAVSMPEAAVQAAPSAQLCASLGAFGGAQMLPGRAADEGAAAAVRAADLGAALPGSRLPPPAGDDDDDYEADGVLFSANQSPWQRVWAGLRLRAARDQAFLFRLGVESGLDVAVTLAAVLTAQGQRRSEELTSAFRQGFLLLAVDCGLGGVRAGLAWLVLGGSCELQYSALLALEEALLLRQSAREFKAGAVALRLSNKALGAVVMAVEQLISLEEVKKHTKEEDCWLVIHGRVHDVTKFLDEHPGGFDIILSSTGKDATEDFEEIGHSNSAKEMLTKYVIGKYEGGDKVVSRALTSAVRAQPPSSGSTSGILLKLLQVLLPLLVIAAAILLPKYLR
ncbi:hypothetical protein WJX81_000599 [Elliptochloris bilobata]|uniref:Cytochrome b5 heme-binding domain-containing protein n=1 Tax=Elliptochloris bilobata TaxID=381761 RepID=A0AAW1SBN0_9CHLO